MQVQTQQTVSFVKAMLLAKEGIRCHLAKDWEKEKYCQEAIKRFTKEPESWIKQVTQGNLVFLQYLYIVWKEAGEVIFSNEEYDELFYSEEFKEYHARSYDSSFKKLLLEYTLENKENYFLDIELENICWN